MSIDIPRVNGFVDLGPIGIEHDDRVALIVPAVNTIAEPELQRSAPASLSFHATRIALGAGEAEELRAMVAASGAAAALLSGLEPDLLLFHCTSASMAAGEPAVGELRRLLEADAGCPVMTTGEAVLAALDALGASRVALLTPYSAKVTAAEAEFLGAHGVEVTVSCALSLDHREFTTKPPLFWQEQAVALEAEDADAVFLSCTNIRALDAVPAIEREVGLPVVTSNGAALWALLRALGLEAPAGERLGSLFAVSAEDRTVGE
jgi:maleate cis-trans isomerase